MEPYGVSVFCEDIRQEITGQKTFIGVFEGTMLLPNFPCVIPKMGIYVYLVLPIEFELDALHLDVYFPGDPVGPSSFSYKSDLHDTIATDRNKQKPPVDSEVANVHKISQMVLFSPVQIKSEGLIKVRARIKDCTIKAGVLLVSKVDPTESNTTSIFD